MPREVKELTLIKKQVQETNQETEQEIIKTMCRQTEIMPLEKDCHKKPMQWEKKIINRNLVERNKEPFY